MSRNVPCPTCSARIGSPCKGMVASRWFHPERTQLGTQTYVAPRKKRRSKPVKVATPVRKGSLRPEELLVLRESLQRVGMKTLREYNASPHWQHVIGLFERQREIPKACHVCGSHHYSLHHRTYKRLGKEWLTDLVPLCSKHHEAAHELLWSRAPGVTLWNAHTKLTPS